MDSLPEAEFCFTEFFNFSCNIAQVPPTEEVVLSILMWCVSVLTVSLNLLVIISISHYRQLHTTTNLLLLSLGVTDLTTGLMMPAVFLNYTSCWTLGPFMCTLFLLLMYTPITSSVGNMVLISVDRYVAICEPMHYHTKVTVRRVQICVCLCWASCVLYNVVFIMLYRREIEGSDPCHGVCFMPINVTLQTVDTVVSFVCPVIVIVLYSRVFVVAVSQARAHRSKTVASGNIRISQLKAARTLGVVVLVFLLCSGPYYFSSFIEVDSSFVSFLLYINSCLNPLIYALFYPWFRKTFKLILTLQILQNDSSKASIL